MYFNFGDNLMDYKNEICPVCQQPFTDGDDIVVCPECGTPHHRECWNLTNRCANSALHSESFEWQKSAQPQIQENTADQGVPDFSGAEPTQGNTNAPFSMPTMNPQELNEDGFEMLCMRGVNADKEENLDGMRIGDIAFFIQQNARHYINKFLKGRKITFNWAALLFAPAWFFYRKLYKAGAIFLALTVAVSLFTYPVMVKLDTQQQEIYEMIAENSENETPTREDVEKFLAGGDSEKAMNMMSSYVKNTSIFLALKVLPQLIAALCANEIYRRKIKKDLDGIKEVTEDKSAKRMLIMQKGGVSLLWGAVVFIAADYIVPALMSAGSFFMDLF